MLTGCATPEYAVRPTPVPDESAWAVQVERTISAYQARAFEQQGSRPIQPGERVFGFDVGEIVTRLSQVTERPFLNYQAYLVTDQDPNAASLADGRIYITTGMLNYLASRASNPSELAFVLGHELAHTVAQHLVKRYRQLQQQQMMLALVSLGKAVATSGGSAQAQQAGQLAQDIASLVNDVVVSGFSQDQELEADQLGIRYCTRAGYDPRAALAQLEDFTRFDVPWPFLRTHPPTQRRVEDLRRYLLEAGLLGGPMPVAQDSVEATRRRLLDAQKLYPVGSVSWKNLQRQLDALDPSR